MCPNTFYLFRAVTKEVFLEMYYPLRLNICMSVMIFYICKLIKKL